MIDPPSLFFKPGSFLQVKRHVELNLSPMFSSIYTFSLLAILNTRISFWRQPSSRDEGVPEMNLATSRSNTFPTDTPTTVLPDLESQVPSTQSGRETDAQIREGSTDEEKAEEVGRHTVHNFGEPRDMESLNPSSISKSTLLLSFIKPDILQCSLHSLSASAEP